LGGIRIADSAQDFPAEFREDILPVQIYDGENSEHYAYVNTSTLNIPESDIHRYADMEDAADLSIGSIV